MHYEKNLHAFVLPGTAHPSAGSGPAGAYQSRRVGKRCRRAAFEHARLEEVLAFGKRHAKERGLKPGDVAIAIAKERRKIPAAE